MRLRTVCPLLLLSVAAVWTAHVLVAQAPAPATTGLDPGFEKVVKPFLNQNCLRCHNVDAVTAGVRVDNLDASLEDRQVRVWEGIRHRVANGTMPPKGQPEPSSAERQQVVEWIARAVEIARLRPSPKNGLVRRLTVSQYRNTLRDLLQLDDDVTETLPPDAISRDGFVNNKDTLQLSPLQMEAYLELAGEALNRSIVDPKSKPSIQNFRMDLGASINPAPLAEELILGANSHLLENSDFTVTQLTAKKPFPFQPFFMRTKYRFIEGYQGNDTVRGWREYDSIYHAVFADMRGSMGYPKGEPYTPVKQGLLLRPAIPNDETFEADGTYGPKANFKISLRELPDQGRFRVTVMAAKYNDGLLLDPGTTPAPEAPGAITVRDLKTPPTVTIPKPGIYQIDVHTTAIRGPSSSPDSSRLSEGLSASWPLDGKEGGLTGEAKFVDSPFGKALSLKSDSDAAVIRRQESMNVGAGDFTVSAWIHPRALRKAAILNLGGQGWMQGWFLEIGEKGSLRLETSSAQNQSNGTVATQEGVIRNNVWQHVAAVVKRGKNETLLYVNGYLVARGTIGSANLDNPKADLYFGRVPNSLPFRGDIDEVRLYRRLLGEAEIQALIEPGRQYAKVPPEKPLHLKLLLGDREFAGSLPDPAFLAVRLDAGPLKIDAQPTGMRDLERIVFTPLAASNPVAQKFVAFEKRTPRLGVHVGLRRDCGSTFAPVGEPRIVSSTGLARYVFEGAIRNFPSPDVEKDNVNYLAGVREIAVRSEFADGRDMPRLVIRSIEFEGPYYDTWPPVSHRAIFNDTDPRKIIRSFATRAYRRPVSPTEEAALMAVYQKSTAAGRSFEDSIKDALQVALTSPQFLFLVETSSTPKPEPIDNYELASKLSYFLWNGPPDRKTLQLAATGTLSKQLDSEVNRMIDDARFSSFIREFAYQWLSLDKFQVLEPDRKRYPKLSRFNRTQLRQEPVEFLQYLIRNNLPVRNLISSDFVVANETVASYYDLGDKVESGLQFVPIQHGRRELGGVLTQAAIMAGLSDGRESNPVKRGAWLARKIIAEPPADPPPNVPALKDDPAQQLTLRQRIERHRNQPGCQQCHSKIDPWGVAFEEFDAGGRLKTQPADARSKLPDNTEVAGINDLKRYLGEDRIDQVAFSVVKHLATYGTGRTLTYSELHHLKQDVVKLKPSGYRMRDMIRYVVTSNFFLEK